MFQSKNSSNNSGHRQGGLNRRNFTDLEIRQIKKLIFYKLSNNQLADVFEVSKSTMKRFILSLGGRRSYGGTLEKPKGSKTGKY